MDEGPADAHRAYHPRLLARARLIVADSGLAEEVVQEAFLRAWQLCSAFDATGGAGAAPAAGDHPQRGDRQGQGARSAAAADAIRTRVHYGLRQLRGLIETADAAA